MVYSDSCHQTHGTPEYQSILNDCYQQVGSIATNGWGFLSEEPDEFMLDLSKSNLIECLNEFARNRGPIHPSIVGNIRSCVYHLERLQKSLNVTLKPIQVTSIFNNRFVVYLMDQGLCISSVETLCVGIRSALDWASKFQARVHPSFKDIDIPKYRATQIALSADDISRIYHFDFSTVNCRPQLKKTLEKVRDMFVLGCNLGQRHSDLVRITRENFADGKFKIIQQKTKNKAVVDLYKMAIDRKVAIEILEKYNYEAPYKADRSNYCKHLHQLMRFIFGEEMVSPTVVTGDLTKTKLVPKYKMVTSHTARRSFASYNYVIRNYSARQVMKATGHTEEKSFKAYICYDDDEE